MGKKATTLWRKRCAICVLMISICIYLALTKKYSDHDSSTKMEVVAAAIFSIVGLVCWHISSLNPADNYSLFTTLLQYAFLNTSLLLGRLFIKRFLKGTSDIITKQEKLLLSILNENKNTVYGIDYKFESIQNVEMFCSQHPLTTYEHYSNYIEQICAGKNNIMTKEPSSGMVRTSGTTGKPKLLPLNAKYMKRILLACLLSFSYAPAMKGRKENLNKIFAFIYRPTVKVLSCGLEAAPFVYMLLKSAKSRKKLPFYATSIEYMTQHATNEQTAFYLHAISALQEWDLVYMQLSFISQVNAFWQYVQKHLEEICYDIENGTLNSRLDISQSARSIFEKDMNADKQRALEVKKQFELGLVGLAKRLWPSIVYTRASTTKTMASHTTYMKETIYKDVLFVNLNYGASEGLYGFDCSPIELNDKFTLAYPYGFFEFIPEAECDEEQPKAFLAHQLEIGQQYELVITNELGLCRYRSGDVIKVSSYQGQCPVIEVMYRRGQLLNVFWEKTPESVFSEAIFSACNSLGVKIEEYTATENNNLYAEDCKKKYTLFIETETEIDKGKFATFDERLCELFEVYKELRSSGSIECMDVVQVTQGTFLQLKYMLMKSNETLQFKFPRVLRLKEHLNFLLNNQL